MDFKELAKNFNLNESTLKNWIKIGILPFKDQYEESDIEKVIASKNHSRRIKKKSKSNSIPESYIKTRETINSAKKT
jgi:hypothetical protein